MHRLAALAASITLLGCVAKNDDRLNKITTLEVSVDGIEKQLTELEERINAIQNDVLVLQAGADSYKTATFDPGSPGPYQRMDTTAGTFLVSLQDATPYLDGFRVTCNFGNPSAATFNGFKIKAKWGPRWDLKGKKMTYVQWLASLREKEISLTQSLRPASWNRLSFVLSPAKAEEFGYLELSMETDTISLQSR